MGVRLAPPGRKTWLPELDTYVFDRRQPVKTDVASSGTVIGIHGVPIQILA